MSDYETEVAPLRPRTRRALGALLLMALAALLLGTCSTHRAALTPPRPAATPIGRLQAQPDTATRPLAALPDTAAATVVVTPRRTLVDKVLGRYPKPEFPALPTHIGKKSSVSIYYGPATVTTSTAGKKAALGAGATAGDTKAKSGAVLAKDSALVAAVTGAGNLAASQGAGASTTATQTKQDTTQEAPGVLATLARYLAQPVGIVVALALAGGLVWLGLWVRRSRKAQDFLS